MGIAEAVAVAVAVDVGVDAGVRSMRERWESNPATSEVTSAADEPRPVLLVDVMGRGRGWKGGSAASEESRSGREAAASCGKAWG